MSAAETIEIVTLVASVSVVISSLEILRYPEQLSDHGLMSWPITQLRHSRLCEGVVGTSLNALVRVPFFFWWHAARASAAVCLIVFNPGGVMASALCALIVGTSILHYLRSSFGSDGADQMTTLTFAALGLANIVPSSTVQAATLWFITLQVCLSYLSAGASKALSPWWRGEPVLTGIFATSAYGNISVRKFLEARPAVSKILGHVVIAVEILFPLVLILPPSLGWPLIVCGLGFHLSTAILMGLNTFFWSFAAAYPAILYCADYPGFH